MKTILALLVMISACAPLACAHGPTPEPVPSTQCEAVCAHGVELGCTWAGDSCPAVCENASNAGEPWRLSCLATAKTCDPVECP